MREVRCFAIVRWAFDVEYGGGVVLHSRGEYSHAARTIQAAWLCTQKYAGRTASNHRRVKGGFVRGHAAHIARRRLARRGSAEQQIWRAPRVRSSPLLRSVDRDVERLLTETQEPLRGGEVEEVLTVHHDHVLVLRVGEHRLEVLY